MGGFDWNAETLLEFKALWDSGIVFSAIARIMGTTKNTVIGKAHREGWQRQPRRWQRAKPTPNLFPDKRGCSFGIGDPGEKGFRFCGERTAPGASFCETHRRICYVKRPVELERITKIALAG